MPIQMKRQFVHFLPLLAPALFAGPAEDIAADARGRGLLRRGKLEDCKLRLISALPGSAAASSNLALGRQWTRIAFHFYSRCEISLARQATNEAITIASSLSAPAAISSERACFLNNTGIARKRILHDL